MMSKSNRNNQPFRPIKPEKSSGAETVPDLNIRIYNPIHKAIKMGLGIGILISFLVISLAPVFRELGFFLLPAKHNLYIGQSELKTAQLKRAFQRSQRTVAILQRRINRLTPYEPYLIIDTSENLIFLMKGKRLLHEGVCSTGSYIMLKTSDGSEKWIFKTPRGGFRVQSKIQDPVWRMPDWAFIEEGLPVPDADSHERFETGVLGDYALSLGDGYLIHGTLYQRFLGLPVTHGCVRLGDKELEIVYRSLKVGSKVFIY
jgi:L,D-transpeptidase ErfK/SrfK